MKRQAMTCAAITLLVLWIALLVIPPAGGVTQAQGGEYDLSWWTVVGGGGNIGGGGYSLGSTIGQPDPGLLAGGEYTLGGGFWGGGALTGERRIYLPLVQRIVQ